MCVYSDVHHHPACTLNPKSEPETGNPNKILANLVQHLSDAQMQHLKEQRRKFQSTASQSERAKMHETMLDYLRKTSDPTSARDYAEAVRLETMRLAREEFAARAPAASVKTGSLSDVQASTGANVNGSARTPGPAGGNTAHLNAVG
jgi:hypothetical protein